MMNGNLAAIGLITIAGCYATYDGPSPGGVTGGPSADSAADAGQPPDTTTDGGVTCTSGTTSTVEQGATMAPGDTCITCHSRREGPSFFVAGTVYPTAHEPKLCNGKSGIDVVITDSAGNVFTLTTNTAGNFACGSRARQGFPACAAFTPPYSAKVVSNGVERAMGAHQAAGDCNTCHTESGANGAPGRIMAP
jgi:hypothetical protein